MIIKVSIALGLIGLLEAVKGTCVPCRWHVLPGFWQELALKASLLAAMSGLLVYASPLIQAGIQAMPAAAQAKNGPFWTAHFIVLGSVLFYLLLWEALLSAYFAVGSRRTKGALALGRTR